MGHDKEQYGKLLDELDDGCHEYSFFRKYIESSHPDARVLIQIKCFEKFKWELSEEKGKELKFDDITKIWDDEGYATAFAQAFLEVYDPEAPCVCAVYERTLQIQGRIK